MKSRGTSDKPPAPAPRAKKPKALAQEHPGGQKGTRAGDNAPDAPESSRPKGKRSPELTRSLQEQAFYLNVVEGLSYRSIGERLNINKDTAHAYVRAESARRREDIEAAREDEQARSLAFYDHVAAKGIEMAAKADGPFMQPLIKGLDSAIRARERRDKLLGLDAPTKVDVGLQVLIDALDAD